eukprot:CAMPEP_0179111568 /NCGR_PEP_ID=MMETSP0796-20121207/52114_1 /TAXON_ID=73915 /ORGANISM="Pyrodinium bahamense, Strain pbaha01" /LENGTH=360 /DNA_ID=CAMNT_0020809717 /DNA_START=83 /DNA_END=1163 /DNA_ORIENTATION=-
MGVPDDANPLNRRLPAEVVSRRRKVEKVEKEETPLATDRGQVLAMKPEHRLKWLSKALQKCQEGKMPTNTIFDIVTHAKFTSDATDKIGSKMYRAVRANLQLFSSKQQRFLEGECRLVQLFKGTVRGGDGPDSAVPAAAGSSGDADGAADGAAGIDAAGIASLWARMTQLSPAERVEAVEKLDAATKELLEDFLEARIKRAQGGAGSTTGPEAEAEAPGPAAASAPPWAAVAAATVALAGRVLAVVARAAMAAGWPGTTAGGAGAAAGPQRRAGGRGSGPGRGPRPGARGAGRPRAASGTGTAMMVTGGGRRARAGVVAAPLQAAAAVPPPVARRDGGTDKSALVDSSGCTEAVAVPERG